MSDAALLPIVLLAGALLGLLFFGGLWWTVNKALVSHHPAWWFFGSTLLRTGLVVMGFYFIAQGDWRKLLVCLVGFVAARFVVTRLTRITERGIDAS